jgi:glycosyltransferase involved in cell wall biosynthesis
MSVVVDTAGGNVGGAARWRAELDTYLSGDTRPVRVIGRGQRVTAGWLLRRERLARGATVAVAPNNVSFALAGGQRRVLARNALHFLYPHEEGLLARMPRTWRAQIPVVRRLLPRADLIIAPSTAMAERVAYHIRGIEHRIVVRMEPVTPAGPRQAGGEPFILVPVVPSPYKNLIEHLRLLVAAADRLGHPARVHITSAPAQLPDDLRRHERVVPIGVLPHDKLSARWRSAWLAFFPGAVESFGYPLAEARAYGVPVLAPQTAQAREIAGPALRGYDPDKPSSIADALAHADAPLAPDPQPFDCERYFRWLLDDQEAR